MGLPHAFLAVLSLSSAVAARSSSSPNFDTQFDAPPFVIANLVAYCILLFITLIQLAVAVRALCSGCSSACLPAAGAATALTVTAVGYALGVALIVTSYNNGGYYAFIPFRAASVVFFDLRDPAVFAAVALVLRHRCRALRPSASDVVDGLTCVAGVLIALMVVLVGASTWHWETAVAMQTYFGRPSDPDSTESHFKTSDRVLYAFITLHVLAALFLAVCAFLVRTCPRKDAITSWTLFAVVPLLLANAVARTVFAFIIERRPTAYPDRTDAMLGLEFGSTVVSGTLYFAALLVVVSLLSLPRLWSAQPPPPPKPPPQVFLPGVSAVQFPAQWGYSPPSPTAYVGQHPYAYAQRQQQSYVPMRVERLGSQGSLLEEKMHAPLPPLPLV